MAVLDWLLRKKQDPKAALTGVLGEYALPSFPVVVLRALSVLRDPNSSSADIAKQVAIDPGVSTKLLSVANSSALALRSKVKNVDHAVSLLGRGEVESLLLGFAVRGTLPTAPGPGFNPTRFWQTAAKRATLARAIADLGDRANRSESFTASLLQDMAIPLLVKVHANNYGSVLENWHAGSHELAPSEEGQFGWNHAHVAGWLCTNWKFPETLSQSIAAHHDEGATTIPKGVALVASLRETDDDQAILRIAELASQQMNLELRRVQDALGDALKNAAEIAGQFSR